MSADDLIVVVTDAAGNTKTLDSDAADPADRPRNIQWGTQIQSGFYTAGFDLSRPIDEENVDIHLGDDVRFVSVDGDVRYEGYITALPRSMDEVSHTLSVTLAGWMAHAADEPFTGIFIDRDRNAWRDIGATRRATNAASGRKVSSPTVVADSNGVAAVSLQLDGPWPAAGAFCEAAYDAGPGNAIAKLIYDFASSGIGNPPAADWLGLIGVMDDDALAGFDVSADLLSAAAGSGTFTPATTPKQYGYLLFSNPVVQAATASYLLNFRELAAVGDHGLALIGDTLLGVAASDVIKYVAARYAPLLNTAGVQQTDYPISHLVFKDSTKPYDAFLKVNSYHLWQLAVWEQRTLYYTPIDLTDWDWEIRHDEVGNQIGLQGDDLSELRNAIKVQFTNVATGAVEILEPDDYPELRDDSIDNPHTVHGRRVCGEPYIIPFPTTAGNALQLGRLQLLEDNQAKLPGSFTVQDQIRDRAGNYQPVAAVRSCDRVRLTSSARISDRPRLIHETSHSQDGRSVRIGVDSTLRNLEGYVDRVNTALLAAGYAS